MVQNVGLNELLPNAECIAYAQINQMKKRTNWKIGITYYRRSGRTLTESISHNFRNSKCSSNFFSVSVVVVGVVAIVDPLTFNEKLFPMCMKWTMNSCLKDKCNNKIAFGFWSEIKYVQFNTRNQNSAHCQWHYYSKLEPNIRARKKCF